MKNEIKSFAKSIGIEYCGIAPFEKSGYKTAIVCLFPYYFKNELSYISKYARGIDYHIVIKKILNKIVDFLKNKNIDFIYETAVDNNPYPEKYLAYMAGLGVIGKNGLLINEKYGSYVFIGVILSSLDIETDFPLNFSCKMCKKCIKACPTKAITDNGINIEKCLSHISQKKELSDIEINLLKKGKYLWGCDICQDACALNENPKQTDIFEFKNDIILNFDDATYLSNKQFIEKYKNRAFSYKGKKVLCRNLGIKNIK